MIEKIKKTEAEWERILAPEQYRVMRQRGTESPFSCVWGKHENGTYFCAACDLPLFSADAKFESGTGWPSYFEPLRNDHIEEREDNSFGMNRTEVVCARCSSHLGHVFNDPPRLGEAGGPPPSDKRYCINSVAVVFKLNQ
ncbi:MAG: peptide-methionine (R)-S-oxide reductase [Patescibacteria group bacterium]|nr:peptide-methionine (R)-S-oxide reductase [Patescibacteria group bacterium]